MMSVLSREPERSMLGLGRLSVLRAMELPTVGGLVYALLERGSEGCHPARVALEGATENELLGHDCGEWLLLEMDVGALVWCIGLAKFEVLGSPSRTTLAKLLA